GHSQRGSVLSVRLAQVIDRADSPRLRRVRFSRRDLTELEYAALLHDFGKIGVREEVLVKAKKLYPHELEQVRSRIAYARKAAEADVLARKLTMMREGAGARCPSGASLETGAGPWSSSRRGRSDLRRCAGPRGQDAA